MDTDIKVKYCKREVIRKFKSPILSVGDVVRAYMAVDRTGKFNPVNMMYEPIPVVGNFNETFEECCMDAAKNLWKLGKPIELFWSGGIDSSGALIALLETKSNSDVLNIRYTQDSIDEFPLMWERLVKYRNDPLLHKEMLDETVFSNHDIIKVTGECGDQCFGSDALHANLDKHGDEWESFFLWKKNEMFFHDPDDKTMVEMSDDNFLKKKEQIFEILSEHVDTAPIEIDTIFDLFWWMNFCFKWQDVDIRMILTYTTTSHWQSTLSFFNTENFQRWSIVNHDIKHGGTWETYKQPAKEYINKYIKDENYRKNKTKEPSLMKILVGEANEEYNYSYRYKKRINPQSIKLLLEDGRFWRNSDEIPEEILSMIQNK